VQGRESLRQVNLFDVASLVYPHAQIISGSYFHDLSHLFETKKNGAYYWDNVKHSFKQVSDEVEGASELLVGQKDMHAFLKRFNRENFDGTSWPRQILIAELLFVYSAAQKLSKEPAHPHFLNFHFHAFDLIATEYGEDSAEMRDAVLFVDEVLTAVMAKSADFSYALLFLPSLHQPGSKAQIDLVARHFPALNLKSWPQIRLGDRMSGNEKARTCTRIRQLIQTAKTKVYCLFSQEESRHVHHKRSEASLGTSNTTSLAAFFGPVEAFHLYVWFFLFLVVVLAYSVYMLVGIEVDQGISSTSAYVQKDSRR